MRGSSWDSRPPTIWVACRCWRRSMGFATSRCSAAVCTPPSAMPRRRSRGFARRWIPTGSRCPNCSALTHLWRTVSWRWWSKRTSGGRQRFEYGVHRARLRRRADPNLRRAPAVRSASPQGRWRTEDPSGGAHPRAVQQRFEIAELHRARTHRGDPHDHRLAAHLADYRTRVGKRHHGAVAFDARAAHGIGARQAAGVLRRGCGRHAGGGVRRNRDLPRAFPRKRAIPGGYQLRVSVRRTVLGYLRFRRDTQPVDGIPVELAHVVPAGVLALGIYLLGTQYSAGDPVAELYPARSF